MTDFEIANLYDDTTRWYREEIMGNKYILKFPKVIRFEPSSACNLACSNCPTGTEKMARGVMREETFKLIVKNLKANIDYAKVVVMYHGGEPFLNKRFVSMLKRVKEIDNTIFVKTTSNGMLLNDDIINGIIEYGLDIIEFSFTGDSIKINNSIRSGCSAKIVIGNIKKFIDKKKKFNSKNPQIVIVLTKFISENFLTNQYSISSMPKYLKNSFSEQQLNDIADVKYNFAKNS